MKGETWTNEGKNGEKRGQVKGETWTSQGGKRQQVRGEGLWTCETGNVNK